MRALLKALISESPSVSSMRLGYLICIITASAIAIAGLILKVDLYAISALCGTFLTAAMGGKVWQKSIEKTAALPAVSEVKTDASPKA
jgi:hypothetical protein